MHFFLIKTLQAGVHLYYSTSQFGLATFQILTGHIHGYHTRQHSPVFLLLVHSAESLCESHLTWPLLAMTPYCCRELFFPSLSPVPFPVSLLSIPSSLLPRPAPPSALSWRRPCCQTKTLKIGETKVTECSSFTFRFYLAFLALLNGMSIKTSHLEMSEWLLISHQSP